MDVLHFNRQETFAFAASPDDVRTIAAYRIIRTVRTLQKVVSQPGASQSFVFHHATTGATAAPLLDPNFVSGEDDRVAGTSCLMKELRRCGAEISVGSKPVRPPLLSPPLEAGQ